MKNPHLTFIILLTSVVSAWSQSYYTPAKYYKANTIFPSYNNMPAFDVYNNFLYAIDGDTIRCFNIETGQLLSNKYSKPVGYNGWSSFITISPDGKKIWAGFTSGGGADDRIYSIDVTSGTWSLKAKLAGNYDLEFLNGQPLVSGLNSSTWSDPNSIFLLDTTGSNNHKKIIEIGGYSAGLGIDAAGNIYYATYLGGNPDGLYKWDSSEVAVAINGSTPLTLNDGTFLSKLPNGAYDCEVDAGGNLLFNSNNFSGSSFIGKWNGSIGQAFNYDTLATTLNWITYIKTTGNVLKPEEGGKLFALAFAKPIAEIQHNIPPLLTNKIADVYGLTTDADTPIDLSSYFTDPDDTGGFTYEIASNSNASVALTSVNNKIFTINFIAAGQTQVVVKATSAEQSTTDTLLVTVYENQSPFVINPIPDISDVENAAAKNIDLTNTFGDVDNDVDSIIKTVESNTNASLVSTSLLGNTLTLSFAANQTGTADIVIKAQSGALFVTDTFKVTITPGTGISSVQQTAISIFPNPTDGKFKINIESNNATSIVIIDLKGTSVYQNQYYKSNGLIDISGLPAGNYIIEMQQGQTKMSKAILKQ